MWVCPAPMQLAKGQEWGLNSSLPLVPKPKIQAWSLCQSTQGQYLFAIPLTWEDTFSICTKIRLYSREVPTSTLPGFFMVQDLRWDSESTARGRIHCFVNVSSNASANIFPWSSNNFTFFHRPFQGFRTHSACNSRTLPCSLILTPRGVGSFSKAVSLLSFSYWSSNTHHQSGSSEVSAS